MKSTQMLVVKNFARSSENFQMYKGCQISDFSFINPNWKCIFRGIKREHKIEEIFFPHIDFSCFPLMCKCKKINKN